MKTVIVSAAEFEAEPTIKLLKYQGIDAVHCTIGIGCLEAAKNNSNIETTCQNARVIFIGTCGVFANFKAPYLVSSNLVRWLPTSVRTQNAYLIENSSPDIVLNKTSVLSKNLPKKTTLCGAAISQTSILPDGYNPDEYIENLELYSCANELLKQSHCVDIVLGVTNAIGLDAHSQWKQNFEKTAVMSAEYILDQMK